MTRPATAMLLSAVLLASGAGCQTQTITSDGRPLPPRPNAAPEAPVDAVPTRMLMFVGQRADDSDGNGFPDLLRASVGLFAAEYDLAIARRGTFTFALYALGEFGQPGAEPIRQWTFDAEASAPLIGTKPWGQGYDVTLSLLEAGSDRLPPQTVDLRASFVDEATGRRATVSNEPRTFRIGAR